MTLLSLAPRTALALALVVTGAFSASAVAVESDGDSHAAVRAERFNPERAKVPALCGLPAARLRNGRHPGSSEELAVLLAPPRTRDSGALGAAKRRHHALTLLCGGYHRAADQVIVYSPSGRPMRALDLGDVFPLDDAYGDQSPLVKSIHVGARTVRVEAVDVSQAGDFMGLGSAFASLNLKVRAGRVHVTKKRVHTERPAFRAFLAAAEAGDRKAALRLAPPEVVDQAIGWYRSDADVAAGDCQGPTEWPSHVPGEPYKRMCYVTLTSGDHGSAWGLVFARAAFKKHKIERSVGVAG